VIIGVVCVCSRGLVHSRTIESIEANLKGMRDQWPVLFTHDLSIPDAQNDITDRALALNPKWLWFVEEDMVIPGDLLPDMLKLASDGCYDVVTADYNLANGTKSIMRNKSGGVAYSGMGCLLIRPMVFRRLTKPYFCTNALYYNPTTAEFDARPDSVSYGGQDINLYANLYKMGARVASVDRECLHLRVEGFGRPGVNDGAHKVAVI
jgi:hypothetical protein